MVRGRFTTLATNGPPKRCEYKTLIAPGEAAGRRAGVYEVPCLAKLVGYGFRIVGESRYE
jgi:hypothetical protein